MSYCHICLIQFRLTKFLIRLDSRRRCLTENKNSSIVFGYSISEIKSSSLFFRQIVWSQPIYPVVAPERRQFFSRHYFIMKYIFTNKVDLYGRVVAKTFEFFIVFRIIHDLRNKINAFQNIYMLKILLFFIINFIILNLFYLRNTFERENRWKHAIEINLTITGPYS